MESMIEFLVANDVIDQDKTSIYRYGLNQLAFLALHLLTYGLLAYFFGEMKQLLVFLVLFIPLRIFAGGYHAETRTACYVISVMIVFAALSVLRHATSNLPIWMILILSSYSVIFFLSPRESINKPLCEIEKKTYRRSSLILLNGECLIIGFSLFYGEYWLFQCAVLALVAVALLLVVDWIFSISGKRQEVN